MVVKKVAKKAVAVKASARTKSATPAGAKTNPFDKGTKEYAVASLMLKTGPHSWDELIAESPDGVLSTRTMGVILRGLESGGYRFNKYRDPEWGTTYEIDKSGKAVTLANTDGPDATGKHKTKEETAAAKPAAKKAGTTKKAGSTKLVAKKSVAKRGRPPRAATEKASVAATSRPAGKTAKKPVKARPTVSKRLARRK